MPCYDGMPSEEVTQLHGRNNELARIACTLARSVEDLWRQISQEWGHDDGSATIEVAIGRSGLPKERVVEAFEWWKQHKAQDARTSSPAPAVQTTRFNFDPVTGVERIVYPHPDGAAAYRTHHGPMAWLYNPWTGAKRDARDIGSDVFGHLIQPPNEPVQAATKE